MDEVYYKPLIEDMVWSFSRLTSFESCPHQWFLKYIRKSKDNDKFYSGYGRLMHSIFERYYLSELKRDELVSTFLCEFTDAVKGKRPAFSTVEKYINKATECLESFDKFEYETIAVEKKVNFEISGKKFTGFIDYVGFKDGEYYIIDHKSGKIKLPSKRSKSATTYSDLDLKLRQLYLYSVAIKNDFGVYPKWLCFNCFKEGEFIKIPFDMKAFEATIEWALRIDRNDRKYQRFLRPKRRLCIFYLVICIIAAFFPPLAILLLFLKER